MINEDCIPRWHGMHIPPILKCYLVSVSNTIFERSDMHTVPPRDTIFIYHCQMAGSTIPALNLAFGFVLKRKTATLIIMSLLKTESILICYSDWDGLSRIINYVPSLTFPMRQHSSSCIPYTNVFKI